MLIVYRNIKALSYPIFTSGELDRSDEDLSEEETDEEDEDSDFILEELSEDEERETKPKNHRLNGIIRHNERRKLSSLSKAAVLLNKQLKKNNCKMHINSLSNGIIHDVILEDIEFINDAAKLLDDFEKINEEAYLPAIKVLFDWMKLNPEILKMSGKVCCYFCILI